MRIIKPKISIVVPVYNSEKYLTRCIDSILTQTFSDFELILINDGSKDKSGVICEDYASKDNRIKAIHAENGGVSKARNLGISIAVGDYLMFCDSDDYVESNWCSSHYEYIAKGEKILPISGIRFVYNFGNHDYKEVLKVFNQKKVSNKGKYFETYKNGLSGSVCCKIYERSIIVENSIFFKDNVNRAEDLLFNLSYMKHIDSYITIPLITYNYVHSNENSLINTYRQDLYSVTAMVFNAWLDYFKNMECSKDDIKEFNTWYYHNFLNCLKNTFDNRNKDNILRKFRHNNFILNTREFIDCIELADMSKEDFRYIKILKTKNFYIVWLLEKMFKVKKRLMRSHVLFSKYFRGNL